MPEASLVDAAPRVASGSRRTEVLARLREAGRALAAADVAELTGLHVNTARFHLDGLVDDGLVERRAEERDLPGRPRILYSAEPQGSGTRSYGLLAEMLTGLVASLADARPAALAAGRAWGRHLVERVTPSQPVNDDEALARLARVLDAIGFEPEVRRAKETEIRLHHCPFREVAERHTDVVCAVHLGLTQGALEELHASLEVASLEPLVAPHLCIARLRAARAERR